MRPKLKTQTEFEAPDAESNVENSVKGEVEVMEHEFKMVTELEAKKKHGWHKLAPANGYWLFG